MTEKKAEQQIRELLAQAHAALDQAKKLADEHKLAFRWNAAYGMGGYYQGDPDKREENSEDGWEPSSQSC